MKVVAVVEEPGACHPSPLQGRYGRDHGSFTTTIAPRERSRVSTPGPPKWITGVRDRREYLAKLGPTWQKLRISRGGGE
jgi:glutaconate CoA-transferase subunit A